MIAVQLDPARAVIRSLTAPPNGYPSGMPKKVSSGDAKFQGIYGR